MFGFTGLWINVGFYLLGASIVAVVGPRLSRAADRVGSVTGMGQSVAGALLLGASTSLPGLIVTFRAALNGRANLAVANAVGGIAAQTLFIALADVALRSGTIEEEDTLTASLLQSTVLMALLTLVLIAMLQPIYSLYGSVHPVSLIVIAGVILGFYTIQQARKHPSWQARDSNSGSGSSQAQGGSGHGSAARSGGGGSGLGSNGSKSSSESGSSKSGSNRSKPIVETLAVTTENRIFSIPIWEREYSARVVKPARSDRSQSDGDESSSSSQSGRQSAGSQSGSDSQSGSKNQLFAKYAGFVLFIAIAGYLISGAAGTIITQTGLPPVVMGLTFTAIATSLPELVTAVSSARRDQVGLAIGDIVGGNAFDTIMIAIADLVFVTGPIYLAVTSVVQLITAIAILMTAVLAAGFVRRDRANLASIGVESYIIGIIYVLGVTAVLIGTVFTL